MTQEDKELLLKDLCARLPYGVMCQYKGSVGETLYATCYDDFYDIKSGKLWRLTEKDSIIRPYLRPMSSMTEEEKKDILQSLNIHGDIDNEGNLLLGVECNIITLKICKKYLGELNKRMFDVCHMIEKGLALEAPEGMYKHFGDMNLVVTSVEHKDKL